VNARGGRSRRWAVAALLALVGTAAWLCAQVAVNPQLTGGAMSTTSRVNTQVYGAGPSNSVRYAQQRGTYSTPTNSEWRHAYWKSGALPSDVRMGYAALGPMNPSGPMAYIPPKPSHLNKPAAPQPQAQRPTNYSNESVRYSSASSRYAMPSASPAQRSQTTSASSPQVSSALSPSRPMNSAAPASTGSVRYAR
jgi:hypothetical protein